MPKLLSILLSSLIFIQSFNISLYDLSNFGIMIEHMDFHKENYGDTISDFVSVHYGNTKILHSDDHEHHDDHDKLPFRSDPQTSQNVSSVFIVNNTNFNFKHDFFIEIPFNFFYKESQSQFEKASIFQPPQYI